MDGEDEALRAQQQAGERDRRPQPPGEPHGRLRDYALAGAALGVACATKYTAGIAVLCLLGAAAVAPNRRRGLALAAACALAGFVAANPYALFDWDLFTEGLRTQSAASGDGGGKLGLVADSGILYYLGTTTWGLGWLPALAALAGAAVLAARRSRLALVLVPAPAAFVLFMGLQDRFFARWLLPVYPMLCLLAALAVVELARGTRVPVVVAGVLLCAQGLVFSVHNDLVLARTDTWTLARAWMVRHIPEGTRVVIEPIAPDQWATDVGRPSALTESGRRWDKWRTSNYKGEPVKLEDYERTLSPRMLDRYARGGYCYVVTGSTQMGRALREPDAVPGAVAYYRTLERRSTVLYRVGPGAHGPFSFDFSYNAYPLAYDRLGPEITIRRLCR